MRPPKRVKPGKPGDAKPPALRIENIDGQWGYRSGEMDKFKAYLFGGGFFYLR